MPQRLTKSDTERLRKILSQLETAAENIPDIKCEDDWVNATDELAGFIVGRGYQP